MTASPLAVVKDLADRIRLVAELGLALPFRIGTRSPKERPALTRSRMPPSNSFSVRKTLSGGRSGTHRRPPTSILTMGRRHEREILERAVRAVSDQAAAASAIVDEAIDAGLDGSHPVTLQAKMLRLELLNLKADLERNLGSLVLDSTRCGQTVHWVAGLGVEIGHWAHAEPAPPHVPRLDG